MALRLLALAACAVSAAAWDASSLAQYVSGSDVSADADVDQTWWHDTSSANLVVRVSIDVSNAGANINTPAAGFLKLSSKHAASTLSSAVAVTSPFVNTTVVAYTVTFKSNAYGSYNLTFDCTKLSTTTNVAASACATSFYTVNVGFAPALSVRRGGVVVTNTWLDPTDDELRLVVGVGSNSAAFAATMISGAVPASTTGITLAVGDSVSALAADGAAATVNALTYKLSLADDAGTRTITAQQGTFVRTDGVGSVKSEITVLVGWIPEVNFTDASMPSAADNSANGGAEFWFNAATSTVSLIVAAPDSQNLTGSLVQYGTNAGQLLAGSASLPGSAARSGGITSTGATAGNTRSMTYPLAITGLRPGLYTFNIPQGVIVAESGARNAAIQATLRVGWEARVRVTRNDTDVTSHWLDSSITYYEVSVLPTAGAALTGSVTASGDVAFTSDDFSFALVGNSSAAVRYSLSIDNTTAAVRTVAINAGNFARADGLKNTFSTVSLRVGFPAVVEFVDANGARNGWYSAKAGSVNLTIGVPEDQNLVLTSAASRYSTAAGGLFSGQAALPGASVVPGGIQAASTVRNATNFVYQLALANVPAGVYEFTLSQGAVCTTSGVCSSETAVDLQVGYDVGVSAYQGGQLMRSWFDASQAFSLVLNVGNGFYWRSQAVTVQLGSYSMTIPQTTSTNYEAELEVDVPGVTGLGDLLAAIPQGSLLRSDGLYNAESVITVKRGFVPTISVTQLDDDGEWLSPTESDITVNISVPDGVALSGSSIPALSGRTLGGTFTVVRQTTSFPSSHIEYTFDAPASGIIPGVYPIALAAGALVDTVTGAGSAAATGSLLVGFEPSIGVQINYLNKANEDVTTEFLDKNANMTLTVSIGGSDDDVKLPLSLISAIASSIASNTSLNPLGLPQFGPTYSSILQSPGLSAVSTAVGGQQAYRDGVNNSLVYAWDLVIDSSVQSTTWVAMPSGALCVPSPIVAGAQVCNAYVNESIKFGAPVSAAVGPASGFNYDGQLDGNAADASATTAKSMFAPYSSLYVNFTGNFYRGASAPTVLASDLELPTGFTLAPASEQPASTATQLTYKLQVASTVKPGRYDIMLKQGLFSTTASGDVKNARAYVRVQLGADMRLLSIVDSSAFTYHNNAWHTRANDAYLMLNGVSTSDSFKLGEIIKSILDSAGKDVKGAVTGMMDAAVSTADGLKYQVGLQGLSDGKYTIVLNGGAVLPINGDVSQGTMPNTLADINGFLITADQTQDIVIDRTAPVASNVVSTALAVAGFAVQPAPLPALFTDAIDGGLQNLKCLKLFTTVRTDSELVNVDKLAQAGATGYVRCKHFQVASGGLPAPWPAGAVRVPIDGADWAGNSAEGSVIVNVVPPVAGVLTAVDSRNVQSRSNLVVKPVSGVVSFTINADFEQAVNGVSSSSLICTFFNGMPCSASTVIVVSPASSTTLARRFSFTVTLSAADRAAIENEPSAGVRFRLADGWDAGIATAAGVPVLVRGTVGVQVDSQAPVGAYMAPQPFAAVKDVPFVSSVLAGLFEDEFTPDAGIKITAAVPSTQFGLTFVADNQGRAYVQGTPRGIPTSGSITFNLIAEDAAGNSVTAQRAIVIDILASTETARISLSSTALAFTEGGADVSVDAGASLTFLGRVSRVVASLRFPEASTGEILTTTGLDTATFAVSSVSAAEYLLQTVSITKTSLDGTPAYLTAAEAQTAIRALQYRNTRRNVTSGARSVLVRVVDDRAAVVAAATRLVDVKAINDAPQAQSLTAVTGWDENDCARVNVFSSPVAFNDTDDTEFTSATVSIARTASAGNFAGCSVGKDRLFIAPAYAMEMPANIQAVWSESTCTMTLRPAGSLAAVSIAEFARAVSHVQFQSSCKDPNNGVTEAADFRSRRQISVVLTDNGAANRVPVKAQSAALNFAWQINPFNHPAVFQPRVAFATGGVFASSDPYANIKTVLRSDGLLRIRKFVAQLPATVATGVTQVAVSIPLDLTKVSDGVFAKGAIVDPDTYNALEAADVNVVAVDAGGLPVALSALSGSSASVVTSGPTFADVFTGASNFAYSKTGPSLLTLLVKPDAPLTTVELSLQWNTSSLSFFLDTRRAGCVLSDALNVVSDVTTAYPDNSVCSFPATPVDTSSTATVNVDRGAFTQRAAELAAAAADLASLGVPLAQQVAAMAPLRAAARGSSKVSLNPQSLASAGSISLNVNVADATTRSLLSATSVPSGGVPDFSLALKLSPPARFTEAVRTCLYVGDTPAGSYRVLALASQQDPADESRGYGPLEVMEDLEFNAATGLACGSHYHFSAVVPLTLPVPLAPTVPKTAVTGGSCPNGCSGKGFCSGEGICKCFSGSTGSDCSLLTCPGAEAWGQSGFMVHQQAECSGRGVCDRTKGSCDCAEGFEGTACERMKCPNDCSGKGRCLTLAELPAVMAAGYESWEVSRVQRCVCDGGYSGPDCSQRTCPMGDDPETVCANSNRQVQRVSVGFGALPVAPAPVDLTTDELALTFTTADGKTFTTPRVQNIWTGTQAVADELRKVLVSLPEFAVSDVTVTPATGSLGAVSVAYDFEFTGATNTGSEKIMRCPFNPDGQTMGCPAAGCFPKFQQLRMFSRTPSSAVAVSPLAVLRQAPAVEGGNDETTPGVWGMEVSLVLRKVGGGYTYQWANAAVYGTSTTAGTTAETPMPPEGLRESFAGPNGLLVDFADDTTLGVAFGSNVQLTLDFKWRLPQCTVEEVRAADSGNEKVECSRRGLCNRGTGKCDCFEGYGGTVCNSQLSFV